MDSKKKRKFNKDFAMVSAGCALGVVLSLLLLWRDFNASGTAGQGPAVAKIEKREARVRRKPKASFLWSNVQVNQDLYQKDSVQTAAGSAAAIRLKDGSLLEMGENSLIVIDDLGNLSLDYLRGNMVLRKASGEDAQLTIGADGKARLENMPVRLVKPEPLAAMFTRDLNATSVLFSWEVRASQMPTPPAQLTVQIARDQNFRQLVTSFATPGSSSAGEAKLVPGRYYWRIVDLTNPAAAKTLTITGQFQVAQAEVVRPLSPNAEQKAMAFGEDAAVQFRWVAPRNFDARDEQSANMEHKIEVASDASFRSVLASEKIAVAAGGASLKGLRPGFYHWRIQSRYGDIAVTSPIEHFTVEKQDKITLALGVPEENGATPLKPLIRFSWTSDAPELEYAWELQGSDGKTLASARTRATSTEWKDAAVGIYRWRVAALLGGRPISETRWRSISVYQGRPIALRGPPDGKELYSWDEPVEFNFEWTRDDLFRSDRMSYQVDVAKDAEFTNIAASARSKSPMLPNTVLRLQSGVYFWRVRIVTENGLTLKASETWKLSYGIFPALRAPAMAQPEPGAVFDMLDPDREPRMSWSKVDGAEGYEVIVTPQGSEKPIVRTITEEPAVRISNMRPGKYVWSVRAIDKLKRRGEPLSSRDFNVSFGAPLPAPQIVSPEVQ